MLEAGIIDDIVGLLLFVIVTLFLNEQNYKEYILV
jgi:Kef-type K+ transport system membrane component KefB